MNRRKDQGCMLPGFTKLQPVLLHILAKHWKPNPYVKQISSLMQISCLFNGK